MDAQKFEALRKYLDDDARAHIGAHGKWSLDAGKLQTALEHAGIVEPTRPKSPEKRKATATLEFDFELPGNIDLEKAYISCTVDVLYGEGEVLKSLSDTDRESIEWDDE